MSAVLKGALKELCSVHRFYIGGPRNHLQYEVRFTFTFYFTIPVATTVIFMVSRVGPKWSTSNSNGAIGPICDTKKLTVVVTWIEKIKRRISGLQTVLKTPYVKSVNVLLSTRWSDCRVFNGIFNLEGPD